MTDTGRQRRVGLVDLGSALILYAYFVRVERHPEKFHHLTHTRENSWSFIQLAHTQSRREDLAR